MVEPMFERSLVNYLDNHADGSVPITSFPVVKLSKSELNEQLHPILINSDTGECNQNLCTYFKIIIDNLYFPDGETPSNYHHLSIYALKLLDLNLFVKNYRWCVGKILSLLQVFIDIQNCPDEFGTNKELQRESVCMKEFLCIILLLLLKLKNEQNINEFNHEESMHSNFRSIDADSLFEVLIDLDFVTIIGNLISAHITHSEVNHASFVFLKFSADILFEYLYNVVLLSDQEFHSLTNQTNLIPILIKDLLSNENFNNYDIDGDDFEDEDKLIAYEEFKLLLLINEQYLMKSYSARSMSNKVFEGLINGVDNVSLHEKNSASRSSISGFINLLVYHINREESHIIKILILKFLYLVFTTSYTTKLPYVNDLKILIDIFIRELNDLDYTDDSSDENRILIITYLKVMYPLLMFSQLSELQQGYKTKEILELLHNLILNGDSSNKSTTNSDDKQENIVAKLAMKCLSVSWLKKKKKSSSPGSDSSNSSSPVITNNSLKHNNNNNSSVASLESKLSLSNTHDIAGTLDLNDSSDSLAASFTRIASVRASTINDYHQHTTLHNLATSNTHDSHNSIVENNGNIFLQDSISKMTIKQPNETRKSNLLDLPKEYLKEKPLPPVYEFYSGNRSYASSNSNISTSSSNSLLQKALKKKAPPPPPPPHLKGHINVPSRQFNDSKIAPPPPPPRRRR